MTEPKPSAEHRDRDSRLPIVSQDVARLIRDNPLDFEILYNRLKQANPAAAEFIRDRAMQLGADIKTREIMARVALETFELLATQEEVDTMEHLFLRDDRPQTGLPSLPEPTQ